MLMGAHNLIGDVYPRYLAGVGATMALTPTTSVAPVATGLQSLTLSKRKSEVIAPDSSKQKKGKQKKVKSLEPKKTYNWRSYPAVSKLLEQQDALDKEMRKALKSQSESDAAEGRPIRQRLPEDHHLLASWRETTRLIALEKNKIVPSRSDKESIQNPDLRDANASSQARGQTSYGGFEGVVAFATGRQYPPTWCADTTVKRFAYCGTHRNYRFDKESGAISLWSPRTAKWYSAKQYRSLSAEDRSTAGLPEGWNTWTFCPGDHHWEVPEDGTMQH